jgi:hypothetical protein
MMKDIESGASIVRDDDEPEAPRNTRGWREFAELINGAWRKGAGAFIEAGRYLIEAKEELDRDQYDSLIKLRLEFDTSTAKKLICIGRNKILSAHVHRLPPCWSTLYELTKIEDEVLEAAIADGRVNPKMLRKDAAALLTPRASIKGTTDPKSAFAAAWKVVKDAPVDERNAVMEAEGVVTLLDIFFTETMRHELQEFVIGAQIPRGGSERRKYQTLEGSLTGTLRWLLGREDPEDIAQGIKRIKAKVTSNKRDPSELCLVFAKKS